MVDNSQAILLGITGLYSNQCHCVYPRFDILDSLVVKESAEDVRGLGFESKPGPISELDSLSLSLCLRFG